MRRAVCLMLLAAGCSGFEFTFIDERVIPGGRRGTPLAKLGDDLTTIKIHDPDAMGDPFEPEKASSIALSSGRMRILRPDGANLEFLGAVVFFLESAGLERRELGRTAKLGAVRETEISVVTGGDLRPYLVKQDARVTIDLSGGTAPPVETTVEIRAVFDVGVTPF